MSTISSTSSSAGRITGLASGMDTEAIVEKLMAAEKIPLNKLYQKKQLAEWKQEAYREISNKLRAFNDKYFNYLNSDTNLLSQETLKKYSTVSSDSSVVTVKGSSGASAGTHTIQVESIASAQVYKSAEGAIKNITASSAADFTSAQGTSIILDLDGSKYAVTLDSSVTSIDTFQSAIDAVVGSGKVKVSDTNGDGSGCLVISSETDSGVGKITLSDGTDSALSALGFSDSDILTNRLSTSDTLEEIAAKMNDPFTFDSDDEINITINGTEFTFNKNTTLSEMMTEINNSATAGVTMKYSDTSGTFAFTANTMGAGNKISLEETGGSFLEKMNFTRSHEGTDAVVIIDGEKLTRNTNTITKDGVTYTVLKESSEKQTVSLTLDTDAILDVITRFVNDYNELIAGIDDKISEDYDRDYPPLTDEQKEEMSDDEIELWEKAAKIGILENDATLTNLLRTMRSAIYQSVKGVSFSISGIGITTTSNYEDGGKLTIDSDKLKEAIESNPEEVVKLFSKQSETYSGTTAVRSLDSSARSVRSSEEGLAYKLYDILQDYISTYRGTNGQKGLLLMKAGISGDSSNTDNDLTDMINDYEDEIDELLDKLDDKEDYYYSKFTTMETYIQQMNSQLSSLQSYLG